jgi:eukaryotic-like serine/threonine-protein kinase
MTGGTRDAAALSRCARRVAAVCLALSAVQAVSSQAPARVDAWPRFRGSAALWGVSDTSLPAPLRLRWSYETKDAIGSSAAIMDGTVYVGSMDGRLHAVDLATGKMRWQYQTAGPVEESSPAVREGVVYVGDLDGVFHAVDTATGKPRWTFKTEGEIRSSPNWAGERIYVGSYDQHLYCLSAATGALIWKYRTEGPVHAAPAIDRGIVYVSGCDEQLRAIDAATGRQLYALPLGAYAGASAVVLDEAAYVGTFGNEVLGIDLKRRVVQWTYRHPTRNFPFYSSAALAGDRVVLGGRDKMIHCLARSTGRAVWTFLTRARVESSPLVNGNRVFVGSNDGILYELDLATGRKVWEFTAGAPLSASPAAAAGVLVIGSQDGVLYCFGS